MDIAPPMRDGSGTTNYLWDALGRLVGTTDGVGQRVAYRYNVSTLLVGLTYPGGHQVKYTYDPGGQMTSLTDWLGHTTKFTYDAAGDLTLQTDANGVITHYSYNAAGEVVSLKTGKKGKPPLVNEVLTRRADSLISSDGSTEYTYDPDSRLIRAGATKFTYNKADDLTRVGSSTLTYNADNEVLSLKSTKTARITYNKNGERNSSPTKPGSVESLAFDQSGQLTKAATVSYAYNGDGLMTSRKSTSGTRHFDYDVIASVPLMLTDGSADWIYGPNGSLIEQVVGKSAVWLSTDQLGSVAAVTNRHGSILEKIAYSPYGTKSTSAGSSSATLMGFTGSYSDPSTGLVYEQARWYDPSTGQFISVDPMVNVTQEPYAYVVDDPINNVDPTGLEGSSPPSVWEQLQETWRELLINIGVDELEFARRVAGSWFGSGAGCRPQQSGTRAAIRAAIDHVGGYRYAR